MNLSYLHFHATLYTFSLPVFSSDRVFVVAALLLFGVVLVAFFFFSLASERVGDYYVAVQVELRKESLISCPFRCTTRKLSLV